jgi:hypothetical protein
LDQQKPSNYKYYLGRGGPQVYPKERIYIRSGLTTDLKSTKIHENSKPFQNVDAYSRYQQTPEKNIRETIPLSNQKASISEINNGAYNSNQREYQARNGVSRTITFQQQSGSVNTFGNTGVNQAERDQKKFGSFKKEGDQEAISAFEKIEMKNRISQLEEEIRSLKETQIKSLLGTNNLSHSKPPLTEGASNSYLKSTQNLNSNNGLLFSQNSTPQMENTLMNSQSKMPQFKEYFGQDNESQDLHFSNTHKPNSNLSRYLRKGDSHFFKGNASGSQGFFDSINSSYFYELGAPNKNVEPVQRYQPIKEEINLSREKIKSQENEIRLLNERISQLERASKSQAEYLKQQPSLMTSSIPFTPKKTQSPIMSHYSTQKRLDLLPVSQSIHLNTRNLSEGVSSIYRSNQPISEYSYIQSTTPNEQSHTRVISQEYQPIHTQINTKQVQAISNQPVHRIYHSDPKCPRISSHATDGYVSKNIRSKS